MTRHLLAFAPLALLLATGCIDTSGLVFGGPGGGTGTGTGAGAGAPAGTYAATVLADSPIGYWPLDELANGTFTEDLSGGGWDAFADAQGSGSAVADLPGAVGNAIGLENGVQLAVDGNHPFGLAEGSWSLEAWVRIEGDVGGNLWSCNDQTQGYTSFVGGSEVNIKRYSSDDQNMSFNVSPVALAEFRHVVYVYDDTTQQAQWFLDGAPGTPPNDVTLFWSTPATAFTLGSGDFQPGGLVVLDEIAVYDRALSDDRIEAHYLCGSAQDCN